MTEFERKILKAAAAICSEYASIMSKQICQDWTGDDDAIAQFSGDEQRTLAYNYEQFNSEGADYDLEYSGLHDGMVLGFTIEQALLKLADEQPLESPPSN